MKPGVRKTIRIIANIYLTLAGAVILFGYASIWYFSGFTKLMEIISPFNLINWIAVVVTLAPGIALRAWADKA
jgi:hypothetical protein